MNQPDNKSKILSAMEQCGAFEPTQMDQAREFANRAGDTRAFARLLLSNQILTQWQLQRLASGRRKLTLGKYVLLNQVDGRAVPTYLAVHPGMERKVEIRLISDEILDLARAYADSDHPGLIHVFDLDADGQLQFLVTETVNGLQFEPYWAKHSDLGVFVQQFRQAIEAMHGLHDCRLSCADIEPNQFWIDASQTLKMGVDDFRKIRECTPEFASDDLRAIVQLFRERSHALGMASVCQMLEPLEQVESLSYGEVLATVKRFQAARTTHEAHDDQSDVARNRVPYPILLAGIALVAIVCGLGMAAIGMQLRSNQQAARVEVTETPDNDWWKKKTSSGKDSKSVVDKANAPRPDAEDSTSIKESEPNTIVSSGLGAALQEPGEGESGANLEEKKETVTAPETPGFEADAMPNAASNTNKQTTESRSVPAPVREEDQPSMEVLQDPFASWPSAFDLPHSVTDNQVALANFATTNGQPIDWSELTIALLGAETAHRGSISFQITAATDSQGDLPEWVLQMEMQGDAQPIAKLHIAENRLMFSWTPQEARSNLCNHLRNCVLRFGYESFSAEVALRSVVIDDRPIWVSCLEPTVVPKVAIEWPPSAEATFLAVTIGEQAFAGMKAGDATSIDKPASVQVLVKNVPQIEYEVQLDQKKDRITVNGFLLQPDGVNAIALNVESIQAANLQRVALRNQADLLRRNKSKLRDIPNPRRKILETEVEAQIRLAKSMDDQIEKTLELCDKIESSGAGRKIDVRIFLKVGDREVDLWSTRSDVNEANRPES
ncbi:MAG: hypothetical protein R3C28_14630 [Pirellulaceae bacterium]